jgi:uncharacterized protein (DUF427 family)
LAKAIFQGVVIAESSETRMVEGNHYFPPESIKTEYLKPSDHHTTCPWKGEASFYDVEVNGQLVPTAAWYYPAPKPHAEAIKDYIAFRKGVRVLPQ